MVGPLLTVALAAAFLGEEVTRDVAAGTVLVLCGIYVFSRAERCAADLDRRKLCQ
jgi:uncharacterized membrane protein